jgi:hypothetical protein
VNRVGQLVPDQRLGQVVQVGEEHSRRGDAVGDGAALVVYALGQARVTGEREHRTSRLAAADEALGGDEQVDDRDAERLADGGPFRGAEHLGHRGDRVQVQPQPAGSLLAGQLGQLGRVGEQGGRLGGVEPPDDLGGRQAGRRGNQADRRCDRRGGGQAAGVDRGARADDPDHQAPRRRPGPGHGLSHGLGQGPAIDRADEVGVLADRLDDQAAPAGAAAREQADVLAEQQGRLGRRGGQVPLDQVPGQPPVGDGRVEVLHQLRLGHDRQPGQVGQLEPARVDAAQPGRVEGRALDGAGQQGPQPVPLEGGQLAGAPAQAPDVAGQLAAHGRGQAGPEQVEVGHRSGGHGSS